MEHVHADCLAVWRGLAGADIVLRRAVSSLAFAQLTHRKSLRDIETCLSAQAAKLYAMGFGDPVRRSTLADANEARDWRIYVNWLSD
jgi:hypothetical protein